jgi:hypothetical protein
LEEKQMFFNFGGDYTVNTDTITHIHHGDGGLRLFFVSGESINIDSEKGALLINSLNVKSTSGQKWTVGQRQI